MSEDITTGSVIKWGFIAMLVIALFGIGGSVLGMFSSVVTAPSRVITKTMETDNIINNYEWFYDVNAAFQSRLGQVNQFRELYNSETDKEERQRLRIDFAAMKQSCRELATKYNANSEKINRSVFKGWSLPETLSMEVCG